MPQINTVNNLLRSGLNSAHETATSLGKGVGQVVSHLLPSEQFIVGAFPLHYQSNDYPKNPYPDPITVGFDIVLSGLMAAHISEFAEHFPNLVNGFSRVELVTLGATEANLLIEAFKDGGNDHRIAGATFTAGIVTACLISPPIGFGLAGAAYAWEVGMNQFE